MTLGLRSRAELLGQQLAGLRQLLRRQAAESLDQQRQLHRPVRSLAHQVRDRQAHRVRDLPQKSDGDIAEPGFELRQVAFGHGRIAGQDAAAHAAPRARLADAFAHGTQELSLAGLDLLLELEGRAFDLLLDETGLDRSDGAAGSSTAIRLRSIRSLVAICCASRQPSTRSGFS